jgi:glycerol-3-phosphate acyltransferase PlsY
MIQDIVFGYPIVVLASILSLSYLIGSIPFGLLFTRYYLEQDIREYGSGNIGATNVLRVGGKKLALLTLCCDSLKGTLTIYAINLLVDKYSFGDASLFYHVSWSTLPLLASFFVFLGHLFPVWLKGKGGKGVATAFGLMLALNVNGFLFLLASWMLTFFLTRISSLSALIAFTLLPLWAVLFANFYLCLLTFCLSLAIILKHRANIQRLWHGTETRFTMTQKK